MTKLPVIRFVVLMALAVLASSGCSNTEAKQQPAPQPFAVKTETINLAPVPRLDEYVATVKSRRSASIQPQVDGSLTRILVKSGDHVRAGQALMTIDPLKQQATVDQQRSTEAQKKATYDYNQQEVERQRQLFQAGVTSKQNSRPGRAGVREFQGRLGIFDGGACHPAAPTRLLQPDRAVRRRRR